MVVADTSPLNYLILIRAEELLVQLYGEVWIPPAVQAELFHRNAPTLAKFHGFPAAVAVRPRTVDH